MIDSVVGEDHQRPLGPEAAVEKGLPDRARALMRRRVGDGLPGAVGSPLAEEGLRLGLSHYRVDKGEALSKALELAATVAEMAPLSVYAILQSIARIDDMDASTGLFTESLVASLVQTGPEAQTRLKAFLERKKK